MKEVYSENYKTLMNEFKNDAKKGKIYHAHGLEKSIPFRCPYYPKQSIGSM